MLLKAALAYGVDSDPSIQNSTVQSEKGAGISERGEGTYMDGSEPRFGNPIYSVQPVSDRKFRS